MLANGRLRSVPNMLDALALLHGFRMLGPAGAVVYLR
jgi:hypothetical protein